MRKDFKKLRLRQISRSVAPYRAAAVTPRPAKGWIRALREAVGVSSMELGRRMGTSRQLPLQLEKAEAADRITLKSLRNVANALDCDLVYALVPRAGSLEELVEARARADAKKRVSEVEHTMALEGQAAGHLEEAVEAEMRVALKRRGLQ